MRQNSRLTLLPANRFLVVDRVSGEVLGQVGDLSDTGMRLLSKEPLEVERSYSLRLEIPTRGISVRHVEVEMRCLWSRRNAGTRRYEQGFTLEQPAPEFRALYRDLRASAKAGRL